VNTQRDTLHHGKISCAAPSTIVIASNSTSPGIHSYITLHSTLSKAALCSLSPRGSLLCKNPRTAQKGLIKKNYWELSFWQKHEKGVTSALLFLLFEWESLCVHASRAGIITMHTKLIRMKKGKDCWNPQFFLLCKDSPPCYNNSALAAVGCELARDWRLGMRF